MSNLAFSYKGTEFPTEEMNDWIKHNRYPEEYLFIQEELFFKTFKDELMELSYFQMLDVYDKAKNNN